MEKVEYNTKVIIPLDVLWDFVKDFSNWAPMLKGYQSHEVVNEKESIWIVKGEFGSFSRVTKFHATINEWIPGERVAFKLNGLNEPVEGYGIVQLGREESEISSNISAEMGFHAGGVLGPLVNRLVRPWVKTVAEELVENIIKAVKPALKLQGIST